MFNVGDVVTVRKDLIVDEVYGSHNCHDCFVDAMEDFRGQKVKISCITPEGKYQIEGCGYNWTAEMFVETFNNFSEEREEKHMEIAQFPTINVPEMDDTEYIERCIELEEQLYDNYSCWDDDDIRYPYSHTYVRKANENSNNKKKSLNALLSRHPNWDARTHSIIFESDLVRAINIEVVYGFFRWIKKQLYKHIPEAKLGMFTKKDIDLAISHLCNIKNAFEQLTNDTDIEISIIGGYKYNELIREYRTWINRKDEFMDMDIVRITGDGYSEKYVSKSNKILYDETSKLLDTFISGEEYINQFVNERFAECISNYEKATGINLNGTVGRKISRVIGSLCKAIGVDKIKEMRQTSMGREYDDGYNRRYAEFADAINPLKFTQKTIISTDRIAFLTASFGNGWASCYTIDKYNTRDNGGSDYEGCYSGGTTSYGSDETTFIFYTIRNDYEGDPAMADKLNRCFFSLGEGKLIQSRNYPDGRDDGDTSLAKQFREIVQKVIADCYGIPNYWDNKKGTCACQEVIDYKGAGYHDHFNYDDCNVSYWKGEGDNVLPNKNVIILGSPSICPSCGCITTYNDSVICSDCQENAKGITVCACCGCEYDRDDMYEIDGEYYCSDCCFYCDYHQTYEAGDCIYIENYGYVCEDALEYSGDFVLCENCDEWRYSDNMVETEDGNRYCCEDCAEEAGYVCCNDDIWRCKEACVYCTHCENWVEEDKYNYDHDCCDDCAEDMEYEDENIA